MAESTEANKHFVYIYRNRRGNPLYVGKGCSARETADHVGTQAHNEELRQALADEQDYTVEIAGPFGNKELSELIEAALIPALAATPGAGSH